MSNIPLLWELCLNVLRDSGPSRCVTPLLSRDPRLCSAAWRDICSKLISLSNHTLDSTPPSRATLDFKDGVLVQETMLVFSRHPMFMSYIDLASTSLNNAALTNVVAREF